MYITNKLIQNFRNWKCQRCGKIPKYISELYFEIEKNFSDPQIPPVKYTITTKVCDRCSFVLWKYTISERGAIHWEDLPNIGLKTLIHKLSHSDKNNT